MAKYTLEQEGLMIDAMGTLHAHKEDLVEALLQQKDGKKLAFKGYTDASLLRKCHSLWAEAVGIHGLAVHFPSDYRPAEKAPSAAELRKAARDLMFAGKPKMTTKQKAQLAPAITQAKAVLQTREDAKKKRAATLAEKQAKIDAEKAEEDAAAKRLEAAASRRQGGRDGPTKVPKPKKPV